MFLKLVSCFYIQADGVSGVLWIKKQLRQNHSRFGNFTTIGKSIRNKDPIQLSIILFRLSWLWNCSWTVRDKFILFSSRQQTEHIQLWQLSSSESSQLPMNDSILCHWYVFNSCCFWYETAIKHWRFHSFYTNSLTHKMTSYVND